MSSWSIKCDKHYIRQKSCKVFNKEIRNGLNHFGFSYPSIHYSVISAVLNFKANILMRIIYRIHLSFNQNMMWVNGLCITILPLYEIMEYYTYS